MIGWAFALVLLASPPIEESPLRPPGELAEPPHSTDPADAEQQFLVQPVVAATAVQPVGHLAQGRLVLLDVGVEQQQRHPAHLGQPDLGGERGTAGQAHGDPDRLARAVGAIPQEGKRQAVRVPGRVALGLPAGRGQRLGEVPVPVQQAHADQRHAQVAAGLEMIAGQDAQAAGVLRESSCQAELRRKICYGRRGVGQLRAGLVPARPGQVVPQLVGGVAEAAQEPPVGGQRGQPLGRHLGEQGDRVAAGPPPRRGVDGGKKVTRLGMP